MQMVAVKRKDNGEWAIPGGMVDAGENVSATLRREFEEEAGNVAEDEKVAFRADLDKLFPENNQKPSHLEYLQFEQFPE